MRQTINGADLRRMIISAAASIDFTQAQELQEILGFTQSQYQNTDLAIWSERTIDITRNQGMFICSWIFQKSLLNKKS